MARGAWLAVGLAIRPQGGQHALATGVAAVLAVLAAACQPAGGGGMSPGPAAIPVRVAAPTPRDPLPVPGVRSPDPGPVATPVVPTAPPATLVPTSAPTQPASQPAPWLAYGDSITHNAFMSLDGWAQAFAPGLAPDVRNAGIPGATSRTALLRLDEVLAANPSATAIGLAFGTNDAYSAVVPTEEFADRMRLLVERVQAAGRKPLLARIPWSPHAQMSVLTSYNSALANIEAEHGLPAGPELYTWFEAHPVELNADGVHPTEAGSASIRRLWGAALRVGFETGS